MFSARDGNYGSNGVAADGRIKYVLVGNVPIRANCRKPKPTFKGAYLHTYVYEPMDDTYMLKNAGSGKKNILKNIRYILVQQFVTSCQ